MTNEQIARAFADQFTPPLRIARTERINNIPMQDAWQISYWEARRSIGITAVVYGGQIHAFIETAGRGEVAAEAGRVMAKAFGLFQELISASPNGEAGANGS